MKDSQDGYSFVYPFGWQEVAVKGQDVVYKDIIEPLESVSVSITVTDKASVADFGSPAEVRVTNAPPHACRWHPFKPSVTERPRTAAIPALGEAKR